MALLEHGVPLQPQDRPDPSPGPEEAVLDVRACGVCRTDLHVVDGELSGHHLPVVPGHEIIGIVRETGSAVATLRKGQRVGVPWLGWACGSCRYCLAGQENLCDTAKFTGWTRDGGYADTVIADARFCLPVPDTLSDAEAAPLLCAGLIGYRAWRAAGDAESIRSLGIYGFGAAAHIVAQIAAAYGQRVFAFTRPDDIAAQAFARDMRCVWAGGSDQQPPEPLDAAIIFAPVGALVPAALGAVRKAGTVVCGGIHMSDIPAFPYNLLWGERRLVSVANLTRTDGQEFLRLAAKIHIETQPVIYPLERANEALADLRSGSFSGAAVLIP